MPLSIPKNDKFRPEALKILTNTEFSKTALLQKYEPYIPLQYWALNFDLNDAAMDVFFERLNIFDKKLTIAADSQQYQVINNVELGMGWHLGAFSFENRNLPCSNPATFEKNLAKNFEQNLSPRNLRLHTTLDEFLNDAAEAGKTRPDLAILKSHILVPYVSEPDFWNCVSGLFEARSQMSFRARYIGKRANYFDIENSEVVSVITRIHLFYAVPESAKKEDNTLIINAINNRTNGGLVKFLQQIAPRPPQMSALTLEVDTFQDTVTFLLNQITNTKLPQIPCAAAINSAATLGAALAQCGGALAGPDFLLSGSAQNENLIGWFTPPNDADKMLLKIQSQKKLDIFYKLVAAKNPFSGPLLKINNKKKVFEEIDPHNFNIICLTSSESPNIQCNLRWKNKAENVSDYQIPEFEDFLNGISFGSNAAIEQNQNKSNWIFNPEFSFVVNQTEINEDEFLNARPIDETQKILINDTLSVSSNEYNKILELYLTKKRSYARFGEIGIHNLYKAQLSVNNTEADKELSNSSESDFARLMNTILHENVKSEELKFVESISAQIVSQKPLAPHAVLMNYQSHGVGWILSRFKRGLNACLADEMGLGKTISAICALKLLKPNPNFPALVLAPKSLVNNWQREFAKFAPDVNVKIFDENDFPNEAAVVICGYHKFRTWSAKSEKQLNISLLILDEAHVLKNSDTQISKCVRNINSKFKLALTGTPLENHLGELWNLLDILNPGFLGSANSFKKYAEKCRKNTSTRQQMLAPLRDFLWASMLRRTKKSSEVELQLPEKIHSNEVLILTAEQSVAYKSVLEMCLNKALLEQSSFAKRAIYLKALTHLKQICVHPDVFFTGKEDDVVFSDSSGAEYAKISFDLRDKISKKSKYSKAILEENSTSDEKKLQNILARSIKFTRVFELLENMRESENGILIFTQFLAAARMLQTALKLTGVVEWQKTSIFDGSLSGAERDKVTADFTNRCGEINNSEKPACPILILSLKAGGVGLNLNCATAVIHLDRWWNPAVEDQATDRAHRIGQTKRVSVITLTSEGTLEESLEKILNSKRSLADDIIDQGQNGSMDEFMKSPEGFLELVDPLSIFDAKKICL